MKIFTRYTLTVLFVLSLLTSVQEATAQCGLSGFSAGGVGNPPCGSFSGEVSAGSNTYVTFNCVNGASYTVSTCGTSSGALYDSQITGYRSSDGAYLFTEDDNGPDCNIGFGPANIDWTSTFNGTVKVMVNKFNCLGHQPGLSALLKVRQNSPTISAATTPVCSGAQQTFTSSQDGGTWSANGGSLSSSTGTSTTWTAPAAAGTYTISHVIGQCTTNRTVEVNSNSVAPSSITTNATANTICVGQSVNLSRSGGSLGSGAQWYWYSGSCGGTFLGNGDNITQSPTTTTTYFVRAQGTCGNTGCASVTVTVNTNSVAPTSATASPSTVCGSISPTNLQVFGGTLGTGATYNWYTSSCGGSFVASGQSINVNPTSPTTYYVRAQGSCNTTTCTSVDVTGQSSSTNPTASAVDPTICAGGSTTLNVLTGSLGTGATWRWYTSSCGGSFLGSGASIGVTPGSTTNYFVRGEGTCNNTLCAQVTVTVRPIPTATISGATTVCQGGSAPSVTFTNPQSLPVNVNYTIDGGATQTIGVNANSTASVSVSTGSAGTFVYALTGVQYQTAPNCPNTSVSGSVSVTVRPTPVATISGTTTVCQDAATPGITFNNSVASPVTVTYQINSGSNQTVNIAGSSSVTVNAPTDVAGTFTYSLVSVAYQTTPICSNPLSGSAVITVRPTPAATISGTTAVCQNGTAPTITLTNPNPLAETVTYTLNGNPSTVNINGNSSLSTNAPTGTVGTFTYALVSAVYQTSPTCNTSLAGSATVTVNPLPVLQETHVDLSCLNSNDGIITLSVTPPGTTAPYIYSITGGSSFQGANNGTFTGLSAGPYNTLVVEDANGCRSTTPLTVTLTQPTQLNISLSSSTDASCNGVFDGELTVAGSGGTPTYQYSLSGGPFQPSGTFTNLAAGAYTVTVKDAQDCENTINVTIVNSYTVTAAISSPVNVSCPGLQDGGYTITGSGGVTPYNYANNGLLFGTNNVFTGLPIGTYTGFVRDSRGCLASDQVTITTLAAPTAIITGTASFCAGGSTQLFATSSTPGAGGFQGFQWQLNGSNIGGATSAFYTVTAAGNYTVVVTNTNNCSTTSAVTTVSVNPLPTITVNPFTTAICNGSSIALTASGANTYTWSPATGLSATTGTTVTASPTSTQTYTVTGTDVNGCVNSTTKTVTVNNLPTVSVSPSAPTICNGGSVQLTASGANAYSWSPATGLLSTSGTTVTAQPTSTQTYTVTGTDLNNCSNTANVTVTVTNNPTVTITSNPNPAIICLGQPITLTSNFASGNLWSTGAVTQAITVTPSQVGATTYTLFSTQSGCQGSATKTVTVNPVPFAVINPSPTASICNGSSVTLSAVTDIGTNYLWSNAAITQSISATTAGPYTVTITNSATGCSTTSAATTVSINSAPTASITASPISGSICAPGTVTLTANSGMSSYAWSNGLVSQSITVSTSGTYTVTVTDANGCTNTASKVVTINPLPTVSFSGLSGSYCDDDCSGYLLTGSPSGGTFSYTGSTGFTANTFTPCTAEGGTYTITYTYTNGNGCTSSSSQTTTVHPIPQPTVSALTPTTVCFGDNVILTTEAAASYLWSNGATTQSISLSLVSESGNYNVTSTDAFGCSATTSPDVTVTINALPTPAISVVGNEPTTFCQGDNIDLTTGSYSSYSWLPGLQTSQTINVTTAGNYSVSVVDGNGCEGSSAVTAVTVNPNPVPVISGSLTFCTGGSTTLTSSAASTYAWLPNGEITQSITASASGNYTVDVVDANGCEGSAMVTVNETPVNPVITALSSTTFCAGESVVLYSSSTTGNLWTPSNETTQFITVTTQGTVTLNVSAGSCQGTDQITVTVNPLPNVTFSGLAASYCNDSPSATLTGNPSGGTFSGPGISGNSFSPAAAGNGIHTITYAYTDGNGCSSSQSQTVEVTNLPAVTFSGLATQYCANNPSVSLFGNPAGGTFSGSGITGTTFDPSVGSGVYTITYTYSDGNGCESSSSQTVTVNPAPVVSFLGLDADYCSNEGPASLTGSPVGGSFSGNGVVGNQFFPSVPGSGSHTITYSYTNAYGCSSSSSQSTTVHDLPVVSFSGFNLPHSYCVDAATVTLTGTPSGGTFTGTGISGNTFSPSGAGVGTYDITYTYSDGFGCSSSETQTVTVNGLPTALATAISPTTFCDGGNVIIYSSSGTGNLWAPNGQTTQFITATASGSYSVTITDANGCSATSAAVVVTENPLPLPVISAGGPTTFCQGDDVTLGVTNSYIQYLWSTGETTTTITVDASDDYSVTVRDGNGCSNTSAPVTVTVNPLPNAQISPSGTVAICSGSSITLEASGGVSYLWSPIPATTDELIVTSAGTYNVTVTDANNCTAVSPSVTVVVNNNPTPSVSALGATTFCQGGSVTLVATAGASYLWSPNGETNQIISATTSGNYQVTINDGNGCIGTSSPAVVVTVNPLPVVNYSGLAAQYCVDANPVLLTVSPSGGFFTGPVTGNTFNPALAGVGSHVITYQFTNGNGCSNSYSQTVVVHPLPTPSFTGLGAEYCVDAAAVTLSGSPFGGTFSGPGISGAQFNPATAGAGTHTITYTYTDGNGCTNSTTQSVIVHPLPVVSFTGLDAEYCIDEATATLVPSPAGGTFNGTGISGNTFDPATAGAGTYTITYTYTDANTCTNSISQTVTVHPLPVVTFAALAPQYCITETSVTLSGTPSGGTFTGTGVTGNIFNPSVAGVGSHLLTYTYTDANGCTSFATRTAVVVPLPVVSFSGLETAYCVDGAADALTGSPAGGTFSGIGISGNNFVPSTAGVGTHTIIYTYTDVFGCTNSTSQTTTVNPLPVISFSGLGQDYCINETPATLVGSPNTGTFSGTGISGNIFSPAAAGAGVHTVTFTYTDNNGCTGVLTQSVTVFALPVVSITPITQQFCVTTTSVALSATPSGGTFSGSGVSGNTFNPSVAGVGTHTITYFYTDGNGCTNSTTTSVTVLTLPTVTFSGLSTQYCINAAAETLTGSPSGGTFSGNGVSGNTFNPATAGVGSSTITYTYSDGNGCTNSTSQSTVVTPLPLVSISGLALEYCVDAAAVSITGNPAGGSFTGAGMSGGIFTPADAGVGVHTISYSYTDGNGCSATATSSVTVNDLPAVSIDNTTLQYCVSETTVALTATPAGGTFSGNGVSGSNFNPSVAGTGTHTITYEYTDGNGCENTTSVDFEVMPLPVVSFSGLSPQYCEDGSTVTLTGSPVGGVFSGEGLTLDVFDPSSTTIGPIDITYTYTDGNGCTNSETQTTNVYSLPSVQFTGLFTEYCVDADAVELTPLPTGGAFIGPGMNGNTFTPASAGIGTHTITYAYQNQVGCIGTSEQTVEIHGLPVVSFTGLASIYCLEADSVPLTGSPVGGYFSGPALNDSVFYPFYAGAGQHTITYTYYDDNGCTSSQSQTINVYQLSQPQVTTNGPVDFCEGDDVTLTAQPPFVSYLWSNGATTQSITVDTESETYVTIQDVNGCRSTSDTIEITVYPLPVVDLGPDQDLCPGTSLTLDAGAGFADYVWVPGGSTGQTLTIVASNSTAGDYRASVTDANGCFNYDEMTLAVFTPQIPVVTANGSPSICDGQTVVLNAGAGFQTYLWSNTANTQLNTIGQSGSYTVTTTDQNGCEATSTPFNVTVIPLPVVTVFANGPTEICEGNTVTLVMPSGYVNYVWNNGETTSSIVVDEAGDYFGSATNSAGCSNITSTITVTVNPQPQPVITPQGPVTVCYGETIVLDAGDLGYEEYNWFLNLNPLSIHSQFAPVGQSGSYTVEVIDANGCGEGVTSPPVQVTVLPQLVPLISISADQDTLYSTTAVTYQWYYNGVAVNGANLQWFVPQASGNYSVTVTDNNDCNGTSAIMEFSYSSGIGMEENGFSYINLFPNPGKGRFTVVAEFNAVTNANIVVTDMLGHSVMPAINVKGVSSLKQDISVEDFANGVYFVSIITDNGQKVIRYIKE
jgi:hypothetical protein